MELRELNVPLWCKVRGLTVVIAYHQVIQALMPGAPCVKNVHLSIIFKLKYLKTEI